jgi:hypothetical protein
MILGFGLLIWLPTLWVPTFFAAPGTLESWAGNAENLAIAAAAWIVADFLAQSRSKIS